jgi:uncharacterized protein (DUF58 family)
VHAPALPRDDPAARRAHGPRGPRRRWRDWWLARHPRTDTWTLTQRNVYILPTKGGWVFALTLLVMLLASINYQLNLGYVLTFLLTGAGLVSIHLTHNTLRGLTLRLRPPMPVFAGEPAALEVVLTSPGGTRHGVGVNLHHRPDEKYIAWVDVPAHGQATARLATVPATRGWHPAPALLVETRFPFGLFRAWSVWRPASEVLAWPAPERPTPPLPAARAAGPEVRPARNGSGAELDGVRAWRRGDSLRQVVWKKAARSGELVSRDTAAEGGRELDLDWHDAAGAGDADARLSRLAAWVLEAERQGLNYGLRLPGVALDRSQGDAHWRELLKALAEWR